MHILELYLLNPIAIILIYVTIFIIMSFIMLQIDWGKFFKKELQTPTMSVILAMTVALIATFCIGTMIVIVGSSITTLIQN